MLKVGFFINQTDASLGGMFTFERSIIATVARLTPSFEPLVISRAPIETSLPNVVFDLPRWRNRTPTLDKLVKLEKIDLMWFSGSYEPVKIPFVFTVLDLAHRRFPHFPEVSTEGWLFDQREEYYKQALPRAFKVISGTPAGVEEIRNWYGIAEERITMIPFATPPWLGNIGSDIPLPNLVTLPYFFYPAQFWAHKNHIVLLQALTDLIKNHGYRGSLVFTGSDKGTASYIREQAARLGILERVVMLGFVGAEILAALYRFADALLFPSFFGPDNLPPLEATSLSCPVIVADIIGARAFLGSAALYANPLDSSEWTNAMNRIIDDRALRSDLIKEGILLSKLRTPDLYGQSLEKVVTEFEQMRNRWSTSGVT